MRRVGLGLVVLTVAVLGAANATASVHVTWDRPAGAAVTDVAVGSGGAIYMVGQTPPGSRTYDGGRAIVRRMTPAGDSMWTRSWTYRRSHPGVYSTQATAVAVSERGVVYVVGTVQRFNCEGGGWFVRSYGPNGRFLHMWGTFHAWHCRPPGPQTVMDVATNGSQVVVAFAYTGCCGESNRVEGAVRAFTPGLRPLWTANVEPPAPSDPSWFDAAESLGVATDGSIYAAGWAATQPAPPDGYPDPIGSLLVQKISPRGRTLWSRRPGVPMGYRGGVSLALTGSHMVIGARSRDGGMWLGELTQRAVPVWASTWGADPSIAPTLGGVAVDRAGRIWMTGSQRLPKRHGRAPFVRRYRASGALIDVETIRLPARWVEATSVATIATTAFVTGTASVPESGKLLRGHVWRLGT